MTNVGHLVERDLPIIDECKELFRWLTEEATSFADSGKGVKQCTEKDLNLKVQPLFQKLVSVGRAYSCTSFTNRSQDMTEFPDFRIFQVYHSTIFRCSDYPVDILPMCSRDGSNAAIGEKDKTSMIKVRDATSVRVERDVHLVPNWYFVVLLKPQYKPLADHSSR